MPVKITVSSEPSGTVLASAPSAHSAARPVRSQACARSLRAQQRARPGCRPRTAVPPAEAGVLDETCTSSRPNSQCSTNELPPRNSRPSCGSGHAGAGQALTCQVLLRKEVIQPHLPVRLPCYDFVPIAGPTFDGSLPKRVRPPASGVADFRDVTGGVYKARERIHRDVADSRLLATPTSWGRVADPNPN